MEKKKYRNKDKIYRSISHDKDIFYLISPYEKYLFLWQRTVLSKRAFNIRKQHVARKAFFLRLRLSSEETKFMRILEKNR